MKKQFASALMRSFDKIPPGSLPPAHRFVLIALAYHADDSRRTNPSVADLKQLTTYSEQTIAATLRELLAAGWITAQPTDDDGKAPTYIMNETGGAVHQDSSQKL